MHHALEIQEILLNIVDHFRHPYGVRPAGKDASNLVSFARTCRTFKEPALDILWERLYDLTPLARCLPEVCQKISQYEYFLSRSLEQTEWEILQSYTHRIRYIEAQTFSLGLDAKSFRILENPPTTEPLFRNLRNLRVSYTTESIPRLLFRFPCPSLTSFKVEVDIRCLSPSPEIINSFCQFSPNIRELVLYVRRSDDVFNSIVSDCIRQWQNLSIVLCPAIIIDANALLHLSLLPALTDLDLTVNATFPVSGPPLLFSNLRHMSSRSASLDPISRLLSRSRLPVITNVTAYILICPSRQELLSFWNGIRTETDGHAIERLSLQQHSPFLDEGLRTDAAPLGLEDLRPCMAFSNLRSLRIRIERNVDLKDMELLALASAWPHLENLEINLDNGWNIRGATGITPRGLLQLLQTCRSLCRIALVIDTRRFSELPEGGSITFESLGITLPHIHINVLDSTIEEESVRPLATLFARTPSSYITLDTIFGDLVKLPGWEPVYRDRWLDVSRRIGDVIES